VCICAGTENVLKIKDLSYLITPKIPAYNFKKKTKSPLKYLKHREKERLR
jgi:hypothetical protein